MASHADIVIADGMESCSQMVAKLSMAVQPYRLITPTPIKQGLSPVPEECIGMGETANLQVMYKIPREASDEFAYNSQMCAKTEDERKQRPCPDERSSH